METIPTPDFADSMWSDIHGTVFRGLLVVEMFEEDAESPVLGFWKPPRLWPNLCPSILTQVATSTARGLWERFDSTAKDCQSQISASSSTPHRGTR